MAECKLGPDLTDMGAEPPVIICQLNARVTYLEACNLCAEHSPCQPCCDGHYTTYEAAVIGCYGPG